MARLIPAGLWFFLLAAAGLLVAVRHDPFFWDTVQLASKHAHHFYDHGLRFTALPSEIDSGHPPLLGYYLAAMWRLFGKSLPVSHAAMAPFLLGAVVLLYRLGRHFGGRWACWLLPLALLDPVMAGQSVLVSPDLMLAAAFLLALVALLEGRSGWAAAAILLLCATSMRGMMTAAALFAWQLSVLILSRQPLKHSGTQALKHFLPGFLLAAAFLVWHQRVAGWTGYHPGSSWSPAFERVGASGLVRNVLIVGWRWVDFGRIAEWLAVALLLAGYLRSRSPRPDRGLLLLGAWLIFFLTPSALLHHNVSAHRYFLPLFLTLHLLFFQWLACSPVKARVKILGFVLVTGALAAGNRWIYPRGIAMGWDATLAHLPYHALRARAVTFLDHEKVDFQTVGSSFPNLNTGEHLLLNGDPRRLAEKDFDRNRYMLVSNVFNDFSEEDFDRLRHWQLWQRWEKAGVWMELYRKGE